MVDSPFHYFSRLAEDRVNINETRVTGINLERIIERVYNNSDNNDNTFNQEYTASFDVNSNSIDFGTPLIYTDDSDWDYYGGCEKCYAFSMLFGEVLSDLGKINNDEEFEKYKTQFVEHYNKEHKELYKWRKNKKGKKPITSKEGIERIRNRSSIGSAIGLTGNSISFDLSGANNISFITDEAAVLGTPVLFHDSERPEITQDDQFLIDVVAARGDITDEDKKRINKKYGTSPLNEAFKKYRRNVMSRPVRRRGWRD